MPLGAAAGRLQELLGYEFVDEDLLREALTHRSYAGELQLDESYERLEFLGDAVLQLAVTQYLFDSRPDLAEGEMAKVRAAVVSERTLALVARRLEVGPALLLGRGEDLTGGRGKDSLLSDVVEAIVGAVFLEAGYQRAAELVHHHWRDTIESRASAPGERDFKTRLQEALAQQGLRPRYEVLERGPEHAKQFHARVYGGGELLGEGSGTSKKRAEQAAAEVAAATRARASLASGDADSPADERRRRADA